ncbi:hypothetical protein [Janthinobacterium sp. PSPC2-1]|uniref:hypothetical protein n=1 Tax=unclassified Janthinobacterium TaxID=2610881 RepID=UPI003CF7B804
MENRSINENWEIIDAAGWSLSLTLDPLTGVFELRTFDPLGPWQSLFALEFPFYIQLSMTKEIARLGEAWADLHFANKRATAAKRRLLRLALPLIAAWGYDAINPAPAGFHCINFLAEEAAITISDEHNRLRHVVAGCEIDKAMAEMIAENAALSAERDRRALAALIPARPAPARRSGWL